MRFEKDPPTSKPYSDTPFGDLVILARTNDPDALFELGNRHAYGMCPPAEAQGELDLWHGAAQPFDAKMTVSIGTNHFANLGVQRDMERAVKLWSQAANHGNSEAMYRLGLAYLEGKGVQKSHSQAFKWLFLATICDHPKASSTMQVMNDAVTAADCEEGFRLMQEWLENPAAREATH